MTTSLVQLLAVLGVTLCLLELSLAQVPPPSVVTVTKFPGKNLNARLLVLDAGSLQAKPSTLTSVVRLDTEQKCELLCQAFKGCTAYVYCANTNGCPGNCGQYVDANPNLGGSGSDNYQFVSLPITKFGVFVYPGSTVKRGCQPTDTTRWPRGLCSLKVQGAGAPVFFPTAATDGWNSAVLTSTQPCNGLPWALCDVCYALPTPTLRSNCLSCAQGVYSVTGAANLNKATAGWFCIRCAGSKQNPSTCAQCLKENTNTGLPYLCV